MANYVKGKTITVTTAGTRVQFNATDLEAAVVSFSAPSGNTGDVFIGDSSVSATAGFCIPKGTTIQVQDMNAALGHGETLNLKNVYADAATNGDKVSVLYALRE